MQKYSGSELFWLVVIHVVFVVSSVLLALSDWIAGEHKGHGKSNGPALAVTPPDTKSDHGH